MFSDPHFTSGKIAAPGVKVTWRMLLRRDARPAPSGSKVLVLNHSPHLSLPLLPFTGHTSTLFWTQRTQPRQKDSRMKMCHVYRAKGRPFGTRSDGWQGEKGDVTGWRLTQDITLKAPISEGEETKGHVASQKDLLSTQRESSEPYPIKSSLAREKICRGLR